jgi:Protein of unknown function (DUF4239)
VTPMAISWIVFGCVFGAAMLGMFLKSVVPEHHLSADSKDVVKLGMGLIATMSALVLALLIASAKSSHDTQNGEVIEMSADFIQLDRVLAHYGPEAKEARAMLRGILARGLGAAEDARNYRPENLDTAAVKSGADDFYEKIQQLTPVNDTQRALHAQAMQIGSDLGRTRGLLLEQTGGSIPMPFLIVMIFWFTMIFLTFGLFAPSNTTVVSVLLVCSLSVAGAIFLILELDRPFEGLIQISEAPMRDALSRLQQQAP